MQLLRRFAFVLVWLLELLLVASGALLLAAWFWSGTDGSLATALRQAQPYLPAGQSLQVQQVSGSIRGGGRIGMLHWQSDGLDVQLRELRFAWQPLDLLQRRLRFTTLSIADVQVDDQRPASAPQPPPEVVLPLQLELPFSVARLRLLGTAPVEVTDLDGTYRYADDRHQLQLDSLAVAQGRYAGRLSLQARAPMTLDLLLQGTVSAPIAEDRSVALEASATLRGTLAGTDARLDLLAQLQPGPGNAGALAQASAMRATVSAHISPWATQPVVRAQSSFNHLDLAALWPSAPRTLLTGNAWVRPVGQGWLVDFNLFNRAAGPWDKGQLPLDSAKGLVELAADQWSVQSLNAEMAGGRIRLQGKLADPAQVRADDGWQGLLQLQGINPALLHSRLEAVPLDGTLKARAQDKAVVFDLALQPAAGQPRASALRGVRLRDATASGRWADGWVRLDQLQLRTAQASIDGKVDVQLSRQSASGQLQLVAPGLRARLSGQFGASAGDGELTASVTDAAATRRWLARLPLVPAIVDDIDLQGSADIALRWNGGWDALQNPGRGPAPAIDASVDVPRMTVRLPDQATDQAVRLTDAELRVSGRLDALELSARAGAARAHQRLRLETAAGGGRDARGHWQATIRSLQLQVQDTQLPGPWNLALAQPVRADFAPATGLLQLGAVQARLTGPEPGATTLSLEPLRWQGGAGGSLNSKGALRGLPMSWLTLLAQADLGAAGLSGNLVFDGEWDVTVSDRIRARASLARRSGDIRIQADGAIAGAAPAGAASTVNAGIRTLQLQVDADGDRVQAQFRWDSERAGNAQATFSTQLARDAQGQWQWSTDSPVQATVRARMPQVGVWSLLAPPGWRVRGTVDANLDLGGSLRQPQWSGTLQASEMAVRSVVDGIEFGNGQLRASLQGQRLNIDSFSLQGAGGASGGELTATGFATWAAAPSGSDHTSALQAIVLQIDAQAKALRVSARADRRLAVSGTLQAVLDKARLRVRGALAVDQALFILPDETAPSLGDDVVVLRKPTPATATAGQARRRPAADGTNGAPKENTLESDLQVTLDLGNDFRVRGRGIDTRVAGELTLRSTLASGEAPTVTGTLRTVGGQYKAYGQQLEIERGQMRFSGAYDNPSLDILAIRPKLTQRVGVQISGTALLPRVRLYAEPDLPEAEKLAWLVLGRSAANGGAEAAVLQQAALALLGGQNASGGIAGRLGLDELSFSGASEVGSSGAGAATVTLGKRISQNFYVAYERSLAGTLGTFSIFYDLSERFTLRARTGEKSALELIYKYSYD
ncbi:MAG: translocation/assembly module TamB domain-containing protein [Burkholderiaceae bacterium]